MSFPSNFDDFDDSSGDISLVQRSPRNAADPPRSPPRPRSAPRAVSSTASLGGGSRGSTSGDDWGAAPPHTSLRGPPTVHVRVSELQSAHSQRPASATGRRSRSQLAVDAGRPLSASGTRPTHLAVDSPDTPLSGPSRVGTPSALLPRGSRAPMSGLAPGTRDMLSVSPGARDDTEPDPEVPSPIPGEPRSPPASVAARRPTMTRSHSLHVSIPSVDVSARVREAPSSATSATPTPPTSGPGHLPLLPSPRPPPLINEQTAGRMARWVKEVVVCNFDLERGPVVERRAVGRRWGPGEKENVAFSSFPDTSLFTEGSIQFSFKIRHLPPDPSSLALPEPPSPLPNRVADLEISPLGKRGHERNASTVRDKAAEYRAWDERGREWLYGFVWFQQKRDRGIARGFMQKSVVILTHLPFPALFTAVLARMAPSFFQYGYSAIEAACHAMADWPDPVPDAELELPLMSELLHVKLPDNTNNPQVQLALHSRSRNPSHTSLSSQGSHTSHTHSHALANASMYSPAPTTEPILASLPASTPLRAFASFLPSLWSLWECLVLAEPVLVIAPDPKTCSEIVWWLRELVRPITLAGDFRPYLHIHDHDFGLLVNSNKPQAGVVVGVTNPFFRNAASHWPNVISIPSERRPRRANTPGTPMTPVPEGFLTRRHRSVSKDRPLLKRLEALVAAGKLDDPAGNEALRMHFQQLTERMLVPLNRYFQTLVPPPSAAPSPLLPSTPALPAPAALSLSSLKPFSLPAFLAHLKATGPNPLAFKTKGLLSKARVESDFYATFCMGGCFAGWLAARVEVLGIAVASSVDARISAGLGSAPARVNGRTLGADLRRFSPPTSERSSTDTGASTATSTDNETPRSLAVDDDPFAAPTPTAAAPNGPNRNGPNGTTRANGHSDRRRDPRMPALGTLSIH